MPKVTIIHVFTKF